MTALVQHQQPSELRSTELSPRHAVTMQQPETAKNVTVYKNGDQHYPGRKFVVNRRHVANFDGFLEMVTRGLQPAFGAVRNVYTPNHGHKVLGLEAIDNGMAIVAGGPEKFKPLQYKDITVPKRPTRLRPLDYASIRPVYHNTRMNVAARWKDNPKGPCNIFVYVNGDAKTPAIKMLLIPRILKSWDLVLQEVTEKVAHRSGRAVRRLYSMHGEVLNAPDQLENGAYYVACGTERFKNDPYGDYARHMAEVNKKPQVHLPPIRRRVRTLNSKPQDPTYSRKYAARRQFEEERQQHSQPPPREVRPPPNRRLRPIKGAGPPPASESDSVFHAKPVKVKRSGASGKIVAVSATEEHEDDVFRARREEIKAEEVADDEDTKVDLPIDQVPADTVEDEEDLDVSVKHEEAEKPEKSPEPKKTYATRLEEDDSELTEPSKTPTSAVREEPFPSARSVDKTEPNGSVIHPAEDQQAENAEEQVIRSKREDEAAVVIQSAYKGYVVRKDLKQRKNAPHPERPDDARPSNVDDIENEVSDPVELLPQVSDPVEPLPLSEPRKETPIEITPIPQDHDAQDGGSPRKPVSPEERDPTPDEMPPTASPISPPEEQSQDAVRRSPTPPSPNNVNPSNPEQGDDVTQVEEVLESKPEVEDEVGRDQRSSMNDHEPEKQTIENAEDPTTSPTPGQENQEVVENDFSAATKNETEAGLPERDAGDGTEESGAKRTDDEEVIEPSEQPQLNGNLPSGDEASQPLKTSQEMNGRSDIVTEEDNAEQSQKGHHTEEGQIPNGQAATDIEGQV